MPEKGSTMNSPEIALLIAAIVIGLGCEKKQTSQTASGRRSFATQQIVSGLDAIPGLEQQAVSVRSDLSEIFCTYAPLLPLQANFDVELGYLCENNKATDLFWKLDRFANLVGDEPYSVQLDLKHENGFTTGVYAFAYKLPIEAAWVRSGAMHSYMMMSNDFEYMKMEGSVAEDFSHELKKDLTFARYNLLMKVNLVTPDGKDFYNERLTRFNAYQVEGGNPDIGLMAEHLLNADKNPDYPLFNNLTVAIEDQNESTVLITIVRSSIKNNGYPTVAEAVFNDSNFAQNRNVREGLLRDLAQHIKSKSQ